MPKRIIRKNLKEENIYSRIRQILEQARSKIARAVNQEMVQAYWLIGREIVEEEQKGKNRAAYGEALLRSLSEKLTRDFGKGFDDSNLWNMRQFYQTYPILDALRRELAWSHYCILMRVEKPEARKEKQTNFCFKI